MFDWVLNTAVTNNKAKKNLNRRYVNILKTMKNP